MISLRKDGARLDLLPQTGGAVSRFSVDGADVLRPAPPGTADVLETACFPLVPFANRIANGAFSFRGETVRLARNFGTHPHVLHGQGWQRPWRVLARAGDVALLEYGHDADDWPWDYTAQQSFALGADALTIGLRLTNRSARAMPASLGFHPYFPGAATLKAAVAGVWLSDETMIPTARAPASHVLDLANGAPLRPFVDHCHDGWTGRATLTQQARTIVIEGSPSLDHLHVYVPKDAGFFCVEPVSAMPDAFNRGEANFAVLDAGESLAVSMTLSVHA